MPRSEVDTVFGGMRAIFDTTDSGYTIGGQLIGVLAAGWAVFLVATWRALGALGSVIAGLIVCAIIWLFYDIGMLESNSVSAITWISLVALSVVLAVGVSWSHLWRRITGQFNVEDVND